MNSHLGECKAKKHNQEIKEWRMIYYLQQVKSAVRVFSKTMASLMKGSMGILLEGPIHIGKHIKDGHISEHAQSKV
jgi:hypothetical protein